MSPHVTLQHPRVNKRFVANVTLVRFLSVVVGDVSVEADDGQERLSADVAAVRFLMTLEMIPQLVHGLGTLSTHSTQPLRIVHVAPGVSDQHVGGPAQNLADFTGQRIRVGRLPLLPPSPSLWFDPYFPLLPPPRSRLLRFFVLHMILTFV